MHTVDRHTLLTCSGPGIPLGPLPLNGAAKLLVACLVALAMFLTSAPTMAWAADDAQTTQEDSALDDEAGFGLNGFTRYMRGAQRLVEGEDIGYRFPVADGATVVVVNMPDAIWVHVDEDAAEAAGFDAADAEDVDALIALVKQLDETHSKGGALLADEQKPWTVTTGEETVEGAYRYIFRLEVADGVYTSVQPAEVPSASTPSETAAVTGLDLGEGALWVDNAQLVPAEGVAMAAVPTFWESLGSFFSGVDYRPFWVSLKTSAVALAITFFLGIVAAWRTMGTSSRLKGILDSVFTIPMVLPPTVCGFLLLLLFGQATPIGQWFIAHGVSLVFTWEAAVISAVVVSFPLMYRTALGAFESLDTAMLDAARTLGWSEGRIFARLMMPLAWPSIAAGTVLAFARAMGEFGCTLFFAGNYAGVTQTIPIAIYFEWMSGNTDVVLFWVIVVILFSFCVVLFINICTAHSQRYRERGGVVLKRARKAAAADAREDAEAGGDALRIDPEALRALIADTASGRSDARRRG